MNRGSFRGVVELVILGCAAVLDDFGSWVGGFPKASGR